MMLDNGAAHHLHLLCLLLLQRCPVQIIALYEGDAQPGKSHRNQTAGAEHNGNKFGNNRVFQSVSPFHLVALAPDHL